MEIHLKPILEIVLIIVVWLIIYLVTVMARFGSNLTWKSELLALTISAIPVVFGALLCFEIIKLTW